MFIAVEAAETFPANCIAVQGQMEALEEFYYSEKYQEAIKYRLDGVKMHFLAALDGISEAELAAAAEAAQKSKD